MVLFSFHYNIIVPLIDLLIDLNEKKDGIIDYTSDLAVFFIISENVQCIDSNILILLFSLIILYLYDLSHKGIYEYQNRESTKNPRVGS